MQVGLLRRRRQIADAQVFDPATTRRAHLGHPGFSCLRGLASQPNLLRQGPHRASPATAIPRSGLVQSHRNRFGNPQTIQFDRIPLSRPHVNPIERPLGVMHKNVTHNQCRDTRGEFAEATLHFLREEFTRKWVEFRSAVTDDFRILSPKALRLLG